MAATVRFEVAGLGLEAVRLTPSHSSANSVDDVTLVFLHDGLGSVELWRDVPQSICDRTGLAGLVYSRAGYGRSDPKPVPWPASYMHDEAALVPVILDAAGVGRVVLVGHSDGASIALLAAETLADRLVAIVVEAPHVMVEPENIANITAVVETYESSGLRDRLARYHDHVDVAFHGWSGAWLAFDDWDLRPKLEAVSVPVLAIQGQDDPYGTLAQIDAISAGVSGRVTELVLDDCAHTPHREQAAVVLTAITAFVQRAVADGAGGGSGTSS